MPNIILKVTVPDAWTTKVLDAFNAVADTRISIEASNSKSDEFDFGKWDFTIAPKADGETDKQFGERVLKELGIAVINMVDKAEDYNRYITEVSGISPAVSDVPDDVLI